MLSTDGKTALVAVVARRDVPFALPALETARVSAETKRRMLRLSTALVRSSDNAATQVGLACLVPNTISDRQLLALARTHAARLIAHVRNASVEKPVHASGSLEITAAHEAERQIQERARATANGALSPSSVARQLMSGTFNASMSSAWDRWSAHSLPTWHVTATYSSMIMNSSEIYWALYHMSRWSMDGAGMVESYPPGFCATQSERWILLNDELSELEEQKSAIANAITSVAGTEAALMCVPRADLKRTCVDFFIMSATVFVTGFGDNRTFDGNAPYGASRLQMYIDFDNLTGIVYLSASTAYVPLPTTVSPSGFTTHTAAPYPHQPKAFTLTRLSNDQVKVHVEAFNGFCRYIDIDSCPAIDADMVFNRQSNGEWTTSASAVDRDNYPSLAVYSQLPDGSFKETFRDAEGHWSALFGVLRMIDKLRQKMSETLGGCQLE